MENEIKIYVASLAHYNAGELVGKWFDVNEDLEKSVNDYIKSLPHPDGPACGDDGYCEEWAIHDYEGFYSLKISEYHGLKCVAKLGSLIEEHGEAYVAYVNYVGDKYATLEDFTEAYCGHWQNEIEYAENFIEDCGMLNEMPENIQCYFDYEAYARDLFVNDLYSVDALDGGIFVFYRM